MNMKDSVLLSNLGLASCVRVNHASLNSPPSRFSLVEPNLGSSNPSNIEFSALDVATRVIAIAPTPHGVVVALLCQLLTDACCPRPPPHFAHPAHLHEQSLLSYIYLCV